MKICKQCNAAQADEANFCNLCGAPLTEEEASETAAEETAAEETAAEETVEETAEEAVEETAEASAEEPKKKTPWGWIIGLVAAVVLVVVLILVKGGAGSGKAVDLDAALHTNAYGLNSYSIHYEADEEGAYAYSYMNEEGTLVNAKSNDVADIMSQVIATCGATELTNRDLQYYFDQQYYYFYSVYSSYMAYFMDTTLPLDEQQNMYGDGTWQEYFLEGSVDMYHQVAALYQIATEKGFTLTEEQQAELDSSLDLETQATAYGYTDVEQFMQDYFGPFATLESYQDFVRMNMIASYYAEHLADSIEVTADEVEAYYDENADSIVSTYGIEKLDKNVVNVRHILIQPESTTDSEGNSTISDEAWTAAEEEAQRIYDEWLAGAADEDSFAELANTNSADGGSNTNGGLYTEVYPNQMVTEFNDWCFADGREVGDHGIVKTSYGYHIMFFSGEGDYIYWRMVAEDMLRSERAAEERTALVEGYTLESDLTKAALLDATAPTVPAAEETAEGETAE